MEILKTDISRFEGLSDYPFTARFTEFEGLRMHYIDEGQGEVFLALHGEPTWSYLYRKFIPALEGYRFIAPDMIGFGKSDKLLNWQDYSFELHLRSLEHLIDTLKLDKINLIVQDWGGLLGLSLLGQHPERFKCVFILNTFLPKGKSLPIAFRLWQLYSRYHPSIPVSKIVQWMSFNTLDKAVLKAYDLPYPDKKHKAGVKAFPQLVPSKKSDPAVPYLLQARDVLSKWDKPAMVMFSDKDKVFSGLEGFFHDLIPFCQKQPRITIQDAGHFLQEEKPGEICNYIRLFKDGKLAWP